MAQVKILKHNLDDSLSVAATIFVAGDDGEAVKKVMRKVDMDPDRGWRSGYYYTATIDPDVTSKNALTLRQFEKHLKDG